MRYQIPFTGVSRGVGLGGWQLRAQHLVRPASRRTLAKFIADVLAELDAGPHSRWDPRVPVQKPAVAGSADLLETVVERLLAPAPLGACGVAQVRLLLCDGSGPLYYPGPPSELRAALAGAIELLEPLNTW